MLPWYIRVLLKIEKTHRIAWHCCSLNAMIYWLADHRIFLNVWRWRCLKIITVVLAQHAKVVPIPFFSTRQCTNLMFLFLTKYFYCLHLNLEKPDSSTLNIWSASMFHVFNHQPPFPAYNRNWKYFLYWNPLILTLKCILGDKDSEWGVSSWMKIISFQPIFFHLLNHCFNRR